MTPSNEIKKEKSVISFYYLKGNEASKISPSEAWDQIISGYSTDIHCMNIFSFDIGAENLKGIFRNLDNFNEDLLNDIRKEYESDLANFMFISPEIGNPVLGFYIEDFLKKFD